MNRRLCALSVVSLLLAACAGTRPAPVEDRTSAPAAAPVAAPATTAAPAVRAGFHIVSKGETLYSIALENGQDWRDLVIWNRIENPNLIRIGQELRVAPPEGAVEIRPVVTPGAVESRPLDQPSQQPATSATASPEAANSALLKREPRGGVEAYSEEALARLKGTPLAAAAPPPTPAAASAASGTAASAASGTAAATPVVAPESSRSEDGVEWSWPAQGRIISRFGEGSSKGVDIGGKIGDPVLAAAGGRVVYAGEAMRGYGKLVIIKHDNTYLSAYAHNSRILVQERDTVKRGQRIAELGDTDTEAGKPRLHFEIRRQGKPVDPLKYLPPR